ncbi:MAG: hypothetical protein E7Z86_02880 [Methanosphaera stadtmanae]|nr:hypothetical protein [Methanosphaera stadtmanae]
MVSSQVGLQNSFTKQITVGIVKKVTSKYVTLENNDKEEITLKLSNIDILSDKELYEWKRNNLKLEHHNLSVLLPSKCDEKYLIKMFSNIEPVVDVEIVDVEDEDKNSNLRKYTFHYTLFNESDESYVEEYISCIGATIV